jgi:hypothetical protein
MSRLDTDLSVEIKRRTEMNKSTQIVSPLSHSFIRFFVILLLSNKTQWFEDQLTNLNQEFQETILRRKEETNRRLDELNIRITEVNNYFEEQKLVILKYVDDRGEELTKLLNQFKAEFDEDRRLRLEREELIVKQLTDHEQEVTEKFEKQIVSSTNCCSRSVLLFNFIRNHENLVIMRFEPCWKKISNYETKRRVVSRHSLTERSINYEMISEMNLR